MKKRTRLSVMMFICFLLQLIGPQFTIVASAAGQELTYDAASYAKDVRKYNGIIFGDHYVNGGDNEGATAVGGDIIVQGAFDYGAADSGNPHLIGDTPLPRDTPGLLLGGVVQGSNQSVGYFNGVVLAEGADPNAVLTARTGEKVFVSQSELNQVFAGFRSYINQHTQDLLRFITEPAKGELEFYESGANEKVLVANVTGEQFALGSVDFPNLDAYDKVIIYSDAQSVKFANGALLYEGHVINTGAPYKNSENFEQLATKLTWMFPNATKIESSGYGVIGSVIAPDANYTGRGGSLNGQLFIHDLESFGGFQLHHIRNKVENPIYGKIKITKVASGNHHLKLANAGFDIIDADGEIVGQLVTDAAGEAISSELPIGNYKLVETVAPTGYDLLTNRIDVTLEKEETVEVTIENSQIAVETGSIKVVKVAAADNDVLLENAEFQLIDSSGNVMASKVTNAVGEINFTDLPFGAYTLKEIKAPEGYQLLMNEISVEITAENPHGLSVIENYETDWVIPETGGIGTMIFYSLGLVLMIFALTYLVRKRNV